jgi:hypothetical protein
VTSASAGETSEGHQRCHFDVLLPDVVLLDRRDSADDGGAQAMTCFQSWRSLGRMALRTLAIVFAAGGIVAFALLPRHPHTTTMSLSHMLLLGVAATASSVVAFFLWTITDNSDQRFHERVQARLAQLATERRLRGTRGRQQPPIAVTHRQRRRVRGR